jgi:hypothetical protein
VHVAIHINKLSHQLEHAQWFKAGLKKHSIDLTITHDINLEADVHIVSGPHYAKKRWLGHRTILIDRAIIPYHQVRSRWDSEDWLSIGWMNKDGGRHYQLGSGRKHIERKDRRSERGTIFLADYNGPVELADTVRLHPAREASSRPLLDDLRRHAIAIGYTTSALVTAGLEGLEVICREPTNIMNRPDWLEVLPYADWRYDEIQSGAVWEQLQL